MQDASRAVRARLGQLALARPALMARVRLFALLILLMPLFAGLQHLVQEGVPRVEIRFVSQDVPILVPVERVVERIVERIIYVPVEQDVEPEPGALQTITPTPGPSATPSADAGGGAMNGGVAVAPAGVGRLAAAPPLRVLPVPAHR